MRRHAAATQPVLLAALLAVCLAASACAPTFNLLGAPDAPYAEQTVSGQGDDKILLLSIDGLISEYGGEGLLRPKPSVLEQVSAQLKLARKDTSIKALLLKVNSPGGTVTASDVIHHELTAYRRETGVKVVAMMMGLATSGGYYVSLPADRILAHPTTITGSVGVVFLQPRVAGLLDKIGVGVDVSKSGALKDMGSPFREPTAEEKRLTDALVAAQAARFLELVTASRKLAPQALATAATARVFTAAEAKDLGLIDGIGYMEDAVAEAASLAGLPADARVVCYRRRPGPNPTWHQTGAVAADPRPALLHVGFEDLLPMRAGLYALWTPGLAR